MRAQNAGDHPLPQVRPWLRWGAVRAQNAGDHPTIGKMQAGPLLTRFKRLPSPLMTTWQASTAPLKAEIRPHEKSARRSGAGADTLVFAPGATLSATSSADKIDLSAFAGIVNLDSGVSKPEEAFLDIDVAPDGTWATPEGRIEGAFAGHEEAVGLFWTPDMTGAFGAKRQ